MSGVFISPAELAARLGEQRLRVVDGSWHMPAEGRDPRAEFEAAHIPGAVFFDIDAIADHATGLPHMLPDEAAFGEAAGALGLSATDAIVVYEAAGLFSAPRVRFMLQVFGARDVRILAGGFAAWRAAGLPLETGPARPRPARFEARFAADRVADRAAVAAALREGRVVVDARSDARFRGQAPEPRPGLPSGHMPGARNLPWQALVTADGRLAAPDEIERAFRQAGVDLAGPVVTTCGSGVSAAILALGLETLGKRDVALYDGSWAEWASDPANPIATDGV